MEEEDALLSQSTSTSVQYGGNLTVKVFQKLMSNARDNLFPKICDRITKHFTFYRFIIVDTSDLNAGT